MNNEHNSSSMLLLLLLWIVFLLFVLPDPYKLFVVMTVYFVYAAIVVKSYPWESEKAD